MPQLEDGYVRIATEIIEALVRYRIPGEQIQCLLFIIRKTYGFHKKWDMISNSQFVKATGMNKSNICRAINGLIGKNIVVKNDNNRIPSYRFNKYYKTWKVLSKKTTVVKKDNQVLSKKRPTKDSITKDKKIYGEFKNVKITDKEIEKLKTKFGKTGMEDRIENLSSYIASKGRRYKSHYATILTWERKNKKSEPGERKQKEITPENISDLDAN